MRLYLLLLLLLLTTSSGYSEHWVRLPEIASDKDASGKLMYTVYLDTDSAIRSGSTEIRYWTKAVWTKAGQADYLKRSAKDPWLVKTPAAYVLELCAVTSDRRKRTLLTKAYSQHGKLLTSSEIQEIPESISPFSHIEPGSRGEKCWQILWSRYL